MLKISAGSSDLGTLRVPALAILAEQQNGAPDTGSLEGALAAAVRRVTSSRDFRGARDETLHLLGAESGVERLLLVGMGKITDRPAALKRGAAIAARKANQAGFGRLAIYAGSISADEAEAITVGAIAGAWLMRDFQTPPPDDEKRAPLTDVVILGSSGKAAEQGIARGLAIGEGHSLARRLGMLPGNVCTPDYLAETAREISQRHRMKLTVPGRAGVERAG